MPQRPNHAVYLAQAVILTIASLSHAEEFLQAKGTVIIDGQGQEIALRGVGLGNYMLPEGYMWKFGEAGDRPRKIEKIVSDLIGHEEGQRFWREFRENYITEADIQRIAELGFNSVRPALNARLFLTDGDHPVFRDEGFQLLDNLVTWCKRHNLYVIIDMHAAPGGQTGSNIDDSANDQPELFMDPKYEQQLIKLWVKIAERYRDESTVAGYDLLNEPLPARTGAAAKYKQQLEPLYQRITAAIRKVDERHLIILEGADWANDWSVFSKPFAPQLVYQFHYYCWDRPDNLKDIAQYLDLRAQWNAPVWVGETGEKNAAIYWATTQYFENNKIGWSFWPWKKMDADNAPYSIVKPADWDAIAAYTRGGDAPSPDIARKAFSELLQNVKLENCEYHQGVVNALFRRIPIRLEAENYGHDGVGKSLSVRDPSEKSQFYRKSESVSVEVFFSDGRPRQGSQQAIKLTTDEWTAYHINSRTDKVCTAVVRAKALSLPASFSFSFNHESVKMQLDSTEWTELTENAINARVGENRLKLRVTSGTVLFDWIDIR